MRPTPRETCRVGNAERRETMTQDELVGLSWEIYQRLCQCDTQREAYNLIVATIGIFTAIQYNDKDE